jgi:hypothetical protein
MALVLMTLLSVAIEALQAPHVLQRLAVAPDLRERRMQCHNVRLTPVTMQARDDDNDDLMDMEFLDDLDRQLRLASSPRLADQLRSQREQRQRERSNSLIAPVGSIFRRLLDEVIVSYDEYTERPSQQLLLGSLALLFGFFVAHGQLLGGGDQGGRWEYVSGGVAIFVVERITRGYYALPMSDRSPTLRLLHAFKVGFVYGCVLDALKLGG